MNPDNNALDRTYFIGGPPRVGKTILSLMLAEKIKGHFVSTDSIRNAAKKACVDRNSDLFILNKIENVSEAEWLKAHVEYPETIIDYQNRESEALWPSLVSFCNSFADDDAIHIVEGVALVPKLVSMMESKPKHILYVGNTSANHVDAMIQHAKSYPTKDWMSAMNYSDEKIRAMANFVKAMSLYFKNEAKKYNFPYLEISDDNFTESLGKICDFATQ